MNNRGFTLLYASLVASLLLSLGIALFSLAQKEIVLSSIGRESQFAFYAADSGVECALYWDYQYDAFATSTTYTDTATCAGDTLHEFPNGTEGTYDGVDGLGGAGSSSFYFEADSRCVYVTVTKQSVAPYTTVEALGYNTACSQTASAKRLERAVRAIF